MTYHHVDTPAALAAEQDAGTLRAALLLPQELGGEATPLNIVYLPAYAIDAQFAGLAGLFAAVKRGLTEVGIIPEYCGSSFVPSRIMITAAEPGKAPEYRFENMIW